MAFSVPYERLRHDRQVVADDGRQLAAVNRDRTGEDEAGHPAAGAAQIEQRPRGVDIDPHAELEVGLRHAADDGREMKDGSRRGIDGAGEERSISDVADDRVDSGIVEAGRRDDVDERDALNRLLPAGCICQGAALEQRPREPAAEESRAAGDDDFRWIHVGLRAQDSGLRLGSGSGLRSL